MRQKNYQSGFGIVGIKLIIALVTVVAVGGGILAYQHHKNHSIVSSSTTIITTNTPTTKLQSTPATHQTAIAAILDIKEWGVHLTLDSTTASLYYYINPSQPDIAYFSLKTIDAIAPNCAASQVSLAAIGRQTKAEQQADLAKPSALNQPGTIQIGNYWYGIAPSHAACIGNAAESTSISKALPHYNQEELLKTLNTLTAD